MATQQSLFGVRLFSLEAWFLCGAEERWTHGRASFSTWPVFRPFRLCTELSLPSLGVCPVIDSHVIPNQVSGLISSPFSPVPQNALPSDLLENVLCGMAFGLGVLGIIVGLVLIIYCRKPCLGGTLGRLEGAGEPDTVAHM